MPRRGPRIARALERFDASAALTVHFATAEDHARARGWMDRLAPRTITYTAINPDSVKSQVEGNILQTLSRTLHEDTTFDRQRVTSVDWATYPILTFPEVPALEFELIQRINEPPLGAGEAASTPVPAALSNAVFDATGVRLREVPFRSGRVKAALAARPPS